MTTHEAGNPLTLAERANVAWAIAELDAPGLDQDLFVSGYCQAARLDAEGLGGCGGGILGLETARTGEERMNRMTWNLGAMGYWQGQVEAAIVGLERRGETR